jgi:general secretion pathway protein D
MTAPPLGRRWRTALLLALATLAAAAPRLRAQDPVAPPAVVPAPPGAQLNYVDADLADVIRSLATMLGVTAVLTDVPDKRITFRTPRTVPFAELGGVLEAILESNGLVLVQTGPVAQVLPEARRPATGPLRFGIDITTPPPLGLITQIVPLENIQAEEALQLLQQTAGKSARVDLVPRSNSVVITDRGANIARYLELLRQLDVKTGAEAGLRTYVYRLKHASAEELANLLSQLFGLAAPASVERTRVRSLEDRSLSASLESFRRREGESLEQRRRTPFPVLTPQLPSAAAAAEDSGAGGPATPGALVGQTRIIPDPATNALVIRTAPSNFPLLEGTITQLDQRPAQVLLEVLIAEVTLDRATQFGINWQAFTRTVTGGFGPQQFTDSALGAVGGLGIRAVSTGDVSVNAIVQALSARTNVRVLSTPRILALNNEEARILVGAEVPFNQSTRTGLNVVVDQTVQFRKVGTQLTIVPTVNADGYVTFRILQEVSALTSQTIQAALNAPVISTREAETSAIVRDGSTIIIGGLIGETQQRQSSGVPFLQDIPLLGNLFKNSQVSRARTELALFVTPFVVFSDAQADTLLRRERERLPGSRQPLDSILGRQRAPVRRQPPAAPPSAPPAAPRVPPAARTP